MARENNTYMVVEKTKLVNSVCFDLQGTADIENGAIVGKGALVSGETNIYAATDDYSAGKYLVANPAWNYEIYKATDTNEENYVNVSGKPFRAYKLDKDMKFKVYNIVEPSTAFAEGDYVKYVDGAYVADTGDSAAQDLQIVKIEEIGFPFCVGSNGKVNGTMGYTVGEKFKKYTIEVVK